MFQFWSAFVFCKSQFKDAVAKTLEQIDVIKRLIEKNSDDLQFATTSAGKIQSVCIVTSKTSCTIINGHSFKLTT